MMSVSGQWIIESLAEKMTDMSSWRLKSVPRSHEESKPRNCIRQAHTCYLYAGKQKSKTDFYIPFKRHDNTSIKTLINLSLCAPGPGLAIWELQ